MNIGIMSMQRIINYGSFLQAWGLKSVLEQMGADVQFVDYTICPPLPSTQSSSRRPCVAKRLFSLFRPSYRRQRRVDVKVNRIYSDFVRHFTEEYLPLLGITEQKNYRPELDLLVIGSDEVFHCTQAETNVGYSPELFGQNHRAKRLASYAASFGSTTLDTIRYYSKEDELRTLLKQFDDLSVRDANSRYLVQELCGTLPEQHIDPVLLYNFESEVPGSVPLRNYVLFYSYCGRFSREEAEAAREFAHSRGKKLISLGFWQDCCDEYVSATPFEVLAYFKYADYVITDTFHGTVMSIKYNKRFVCLVRSSNKQKMQSLLRDFGLIGQIADSACMFEEKLTGPIAYDIANDYLACQQLVSRAYLQQQIDEISKH